MGTRGQIIVETTELDKVAGKVERYADDYKTEYMKLYNLVTEMKNAWEGADNTAYTTRIEGFRDDFKKMEDLMREYAEFLKESAAKYRATQEKIKSDAQRLATNA